MTPDWGAAWTFAGVILAVFGSLSLVGMAMTVLWPQSVYVLAAIVGVLLLSVCGHVVWRWWRV